MKKILKTLSVITIILAGFYEFHELSNIIHPVASSPVITKRDDSLRNSLIYLGCPARKVTEVSNGVTIASERTGISRLLISSLLYTESNFQYTVVSKKGYVGIAQTPYASKVYAEVDILHGAMILKDKLRLVNGNIPDAFMLYKGGRNPEARKQANQVMALYEKLVKRFA